ncbi:hypothetical protein [Caballeronia arvi]|nr:hypothetical protein [Caballeronia arvi]
MPEVAWKTFVARTQAIVAAARAVVDQVVNFEIALLLIHRNEDYR